MINLTSLETELRAAIVTLENQTEAIANARTVKANDSDQRKQSLTGIQAGWIIQGDSVAASEVKARASTNYVQMAGLLGESLKAAEEIIAINDVAWAKFNALRELVKAAAAATAAIAA